MTNGARTPSGSKTLVTVERTVQSVEVVVLVILVVCCTNIESSIVSHLTARTRCTVILGNISPPSMEKIASLVLDTNLVRSQGGF